MNRKKKRGALTAVVLLIVIAIPLAIAYLMLRQNMDSNLNHGSLTGVTLTAENQSNHLTAEEEIEFFRSVILSGEAVAETANPIDSYRQFTLTFHKLKADVVFTLYLSDSVYDCLFRNEQGALHLIPAEMASGLLSHSLITNYAVNFAQRPTVQLLQKGILYDAAAIKGSWIYSRANDKSAEKTIDETSDAVAVLPQGEKLQLQFSRTPDFVSLRLMNSHGELLYSGSPEDVVFPLPETDAHLELVVDCNWFESAEEDWHGTLEYRFDLFYDVPSRIEVSSEYAVAGSGLVYTVYHSSSEELAVITTFPDVSVQPVRERGVWTVVIPIPQDALGEYEIILMGSDVEASFVLDVIPPEEAPDEEPEE